MIVSSPISKLQDLFISSPTTYVEDFVTLVKTSRSLALPYSSSQKLHHKLTTGQFFIHSSLSDCYVPSTYTLNSESYPLSFQFEVPEGAICDSSDLQQRSLYLGYHVVPFDNSITSSSVLLSFSSPDSFSIGSVINAIGIVEENVFVEHLDNTFTVINVVSHQDFIDALIHDVTTDDVTLSDLECLADLLHFSPESLENSNLLSLLLLISLVTVPSKFSLNFKNLSEPSYCNLLNIVRFFSPLVSTMNVTTDYLNNSDIFPYLSSESELLSTAFFPIPNHSVLVIKFHELETSSLTAKGLDNLVLLKSLISDGFLKIKYPFGETQIEVKFSVITVVPEDFEFSSHFIVNAKNLNILEHTQPLDSAKTSSIKNSILFAQAYRNLDIPNEVTHAIENDYVTTRSSNPLFSSDLLSGVVYLSTVLSKICNKNEVSLEVWKRFGLY
ncbi:hypothetical protein GEMRC1_011536 [Eukaryota sp. GEM-RC1]